MKDFIKNIIKEQIKSKDVLIKYNDLIKKYEVREIKVFNCVKEKIEKENPNVKISFKIRNPIFNAYVYKHYGNLKIDRNIGYTISIDNTNSDIIYQSVLNRISKIHSECESKISVGPLPDIKKIPFISGNITYLKSSSFRNRQLNSKLYNDFTKWIGNKEPYPGDENSHLFLPRIEQIKGTKPDSESSGERMVRLFMEENKVKFKQYHKMKGCFSEKNGKCYLLTFDFYIPSKNLVIEYDGGQHFAPVSKFGGQETFERTVMLDNIKNKFCEDNKIKMLRIPYTKKQLEVYEILKKELGIK